MELSIEIFTEENSRTTSYILRGNVLLFNLTLRKFYLKQGASMVEVFELGICTGGTVKACSHCAIFLIATVICHGLDRSW